MYRFLDQSRSLVLKLQPAWQAWCHQNLPNVSEENACLSSFEAGTLNICVNNSSTAALIKHKQVNALKALNLAFIALNPKHMNKPEQSETPITKLKVRVDLMSVNAANELQREIKKSDENAYQHKPVDTQSIESIERLQKSIKNPELADTLGKLAETLKNIS